MSNSLILLSGGPDSATLAAWAKINGHDNLKALYLQAGHVTDQKEIESADKTAAALGSQLEIIDVASMVSALGSQRLLIHSEASIMPFGNAIVLSMAVTYALKVKASSILVALHYDDASESNEYSREFINRIEKLAQWTQGDINILTPFINMRKHEVFKLGHDLGVDYSKTWSCVRPGEVHCGYCGACRARSKAFADIQKRDPTIYKQSVMALASVSVSR